MSKRFSIKIGGQSGTGINSVGLILSKSLKRTGYFSVSYREYPSLIKGGYASYKLDFSNKYIGAISKKSNIVVAIDKWSFEHLLEEINEVDVFIYDKNLIRIDEVEQAKLDESDAYVFPLNLTMTAKQVGGNTIMKNTVLLGALWNLIGLDIEILNKVIRDTFNKTKEIEEKNVACSIAGSELIASNHTFIGEMNGVEEPKEMLSISGNEAIVFGALTAGVRAYFGYPMTPSSSILSTMSKFAFKTGVLIKQAEDEITAINMTIGANHAGTRAMTATSGGGFDLMTEAISLAGITETPLVVALAQRPGPGTGVPTWTAQGDLNIAVYSGHGQFARIVAAPGDVDECYRLTALAHNFAEKIQSPAIILTDKYLAETMYTAKSFDDSDFEIDRGELIVENIDPEQNRYKITENGVSPRWLPGKRGAKTYVSNSDEHNELGDSTEDPVEIENQILKRMRKEKLAYDLVPEPILYGENEAEIALIGWGSTKDIVLDAMSMLQKEGIKVKFLHFSFVFPLRREILDKFLAQHESPLVIENNEKGQFADLIQKETGKMMRHRFLKFNGSPFFVEEVFEKIKSLV